MISKIIWAIQFIIVINWFIGLATLTSSLMVIYGGAKYILTGENKEKGSRAGKMFIYSSVILIILAFLYAIFNPPLIAPPLR